MLERSGLIKASEEVEKFIFEDLEQKRKTQQFQALRETELVQAEISDLINKNKFDKAYDRVEQLKTVDERHFHFQFISIYLKQKLMTLEDDLITSRVIFLINSKPMQRSRAYKLINAYRAIQNKTNTILDTDVINAEIKTIEKNEEELITRLKELERQRNSFLMHAKVSETFRLLTRDLLVNRLKFPRIKSYDIVWEKLKILFSGFDVQASESLFNQISLLQSQRNDLKKLFAGSEYNEEKFFISRAVGELEKVCELIIKYNELLKIYPIEIENPDSRQLLEQLDDLDKLTLPLLFKAIKMQGNTTQPIFNLFEKYDNILLSRIKDLPKSIKEEDELAKININLVSDLSQSERLIADAQAAQIANEKNKKKKNSNMEAYHALIAKPWPEADLSIPKIIKNIQLKIRNFLNHFSPITHEEIEFFDDLKVFLNEVLMNTSLLDSQVIEKSLPNFYQKNINNLSYAKDWFRAVKLWVNAKIKEEKSEQIQSQGALQSGLQLHSQGALAARRIESQQASQSVDRSISFSGSASTSKQPSVGWNILGIFGGVGSSVVGFCAVLGVGSLVALGPAGWAFLALGVVLGSYNAYQTHKKLNASNPENKVDDIELFPPAEISSAELVTQEDKQQESSTKSSVMRIHSAIRANQNPEALMQMEIYKPENANKKNVLEEILKLDEEPRLKYLIFMYVLIGRFSKAINALEHTLITPKTNKHIIAEIRVLMQKAQSKKKGEIVLDQVAQVHKAHASHDLLELPAFEQTRKLTIVGRATN